MLLQSSWHLVPALLCQGRQQGRRLQCTARASPLLSAMTSAPDQGRAGRTTRVEQPTTAQPSQVAGRLTLKAWGRTAMSRAVIWDLSRDTSGCWRQDDTLI